MTTYLKEDGMTVVEREVVEAPAVVPVTTREVLHRAADLLEEFGWCQRSAGRSACGTAVDLHYVVSGTPCVAFCHNGAIFRASMDLGRDRVPAGLATAEAAMFNDAPGRTKAEVVARLRAAAESA